jgi:ribosomal protein L11 methylase PrmA
MTTLPPNWQRDPGSRRDPFGQVWLAGDRLFRTLNQIGAQHYHTVQASGLLSQLLEQGKLIPSQLTATKEDADPEMTLVLEHPKLSSWSYPYEWSFGALRDAALLHLDIQLQALEHHIVLTDASAYNIQFVRANPIFIDYGSFRPYQPGEYWQGLKQFCEEFLYPLYFSAYCHLPWQPWYRAQLRGMAATQLWRVIPWFRRRHFHLWRNIFIPAWLGNSNAVIPKQLPALQINIYRATLEKMQHTIRTLPAPGFQNHWQHYPTTQSYPTEAKHKKIEILINFIRTSHVQQLVDLGCNTGEYAEFALAAGVQEVVGLEQDAASLELAYQRAKQKQLNFLPLYQDLLNPSPAQGFAQVERSSIKTRLKDVDGLLAFACLHHLALPHALDLGDITCWLVSLAPRGLIEFVAAEDPQAATLAVQPRATPYNRMYFEQQLKQIADMPTARNGTDYLLVRT